MKVEIKKATLYGAGDLRIESEAYDTDTLAPDEVLVRTAYSGFSTGTDLGNYLGKSTEVPGAPDYPRGVGYSNVGVVSHAGSAVTAVKPGDTVFSIKPHQSVFIAGKDDLLIPIPAGVDLAQASLGYLVNLGLAALNSVDYKLGERVAVIGLGVIGLCTVALGRAIGAPIAAIANDPIRAELAMRLGAQEFRDNFDIVVLTANTWSAYRSAVDIARYRGRVSVLGFPGRGQEPPDFNPLDPQWLYGKQLTIAGAGFAPDRRRNLTSIFEWMRSGTLDIGPVISHRIPYERMVEAYELARSHSKELTAAVFDWRNV